MPTSISGKWRGFLEPGLLIVFVLGLTLRLIGLNWGIPTADIPHAPFHPDETWAISVLAEINIFEGQFNPPSAHREGTLVYYIWTFFLSILYFVGYLTKMPNQLSGFDLDFARTLFACRFVTAIFDSLTILVVYGCLKRMTKSSLAGFFGALVFALIPFEIIYAHYTRTHAFSNFLVTLVVYTAFCLDSNSPKKHIFGVGILCGFSTAAKYTGLVSIVAPTLVLWNLARDEGVRLVSRKLLRQLGTLGGGLLTGFFIADPYLFLKYHIAKNAVNYQASYAATGEFSFLSLFDLSRLWVYIEYLIPFGSLPALWVLFYVSVLVLLVTPRLYRYSLPLLAVLFGYLYPMSKGYFAVPIFVRGAITTFPLFALLSGLGLFELWRQTRERKVARSIFLMSVGSILATTLLYDLAYVTSMARSDSRLQLYHYFKDKKGLTIGLPGTGHDYFLINPTADLLKKENTIVTRNGENEGQLDYLILSAFETGHEKLAQQKIEELKDRFTLETVFENPISFAGATFKYERHPHDMQYPLSEALSARLQKGPNSLTVLPTLLTKIPRQPHQGHQSGDTRH